MKLFAPMTALTLALIAGSPGLGAQTASQAPSDLEASFGPVQEEFLARVVGRTLDPAPARAFLLAHQISPERLLPASLAVARVLNVGHTFDEPDCALPGLQTAVLRFRADLVTAGPEAEDQPDLLFTVVFARRDGHWTKMASQAVWEVDPIFPPNDLRYAARAFSRELGQRMNDLPAYP